MNDFADSEKKLLTIAKENELDLNQLKTADEVFGVFAKKFVNGKISFYDLSVACELMVEEHGVFEILNRPKYGQLMAPMADVHGYIDMGNDDADFVLGMARDVLVEFAV